MAVLHRAALEALLLRTHCGCAAVRGAGATKSQQAPASSHCAVPRGEECRDARPAPLHCWEVWQALTQAGRAQGAVRTCLEGKQQ